MDKHEGWLRDELIGCYCQIMGGFEVMVFCRTCTDQIDEATATYESEKHVLGMKNFNPMKPGRAGKRPKVIRANPLSCYQYSHLCDICRFLLCVCTQALCCPQQEYFLRPPPRVQRRDLKEFFERQRQLLAKEVEVKVSLVKLENAEDDGGEKGLHGQKDEGNA